MEEMDYYEALGVEAPEDTDANTDTTEVSSEEVTSEDTVESKDADSEDTDGAGESEDESTDGADSSTEAEAAKKQDRDTNAKFAAARRRAEAESRSREAAAVKTAREAAVTETLKAIAAKNPYTGKLIETAEDLEAFRTAQAEKTKQQFMRSSGQSEEQYKQTVSALPEVRTAQDELTRAKERADAAEAKLREADEERFKTSLEDEVRRIAQTGEAVESLADIAKLEKYPEMREKIRRGYTLEDAYLTVYRDEIEARKQEKRNERAALSAASKSHMTRTKSKGNAMASVPSDVIAEYRTLMPGMSDADIAKHYNSYLKKRR